MKGRKKMSDMEYDRRSSDRQIEKMKDQLAAIESRTNILEHSQKICCDKVVERHTLEISLLDKETERQKHVLGNILKFIEDQTELNKTNSDFNKKMLINYLRLTITIGVFAGIILFLGDDVFKMIIDHYGPAE